MDKFLKRISSYIDEKIKGHPRVAEAIYTLIPPSVTVGGSSLIYLTYEFKLHPGLLFLGQILCFLSLPAAFYCEEALKRYRK